MPTATCVNNHVFKVHKKSALAGKTGLPASTCPVCKKAAEQARKEGLKGAAASRRFARRKKKADEDEQ